MPKAKIALRRKAQTAPAAASPRKTALVFKPADDPFGDLELRVGKHIRELRVAKGLSLTELAGKVEVSVGNLSEMERGLSVPSIRTLCLLSKALDIGAGWLLDLHAESGPPVDPYVVRASARQSIVYSKAGVVKRLASPLSPGQLQMLLVEIEPGAGSGESGYSHAGEECGIVQEGILNLWIEGEKHTLSQGDSFRFASTKIHRFENPGNVLTRVLWITSPPLY
ncbi:MAG: helix-turn-helix domain-containing protein [Dongiaceae bacterium]